MLPLWHRRVSRYIDSIILNGLIKCILNNTKLEKKGATNCIYSVLRKCCYSFNFICDIIIIFPPFRARRRAREPRVNTVDGSEVAEFSSSRGWGGGGEGLVLWAEEDLAGGPVETGWAASLCWRWLQVGSPETGKQSICLQNGFFSSLPPHQCRSLSCALHVVLAVCPSWWTWTEGFVFVLWWLQRVTLQCHLPGTQ